MKYCKRCGTLTERISNGRCAICTRAASNRSRKANNSDNSPAKKLWREANREKMRISQRKSSKKWREKNLERARRMVREHARASHRKKVGWTRELFDAAWAQQNGMCAICNVMMDPVGRGPTSVNADHDHAALRIRGLICHHCNRGLGLFKDNPKILRSAALYLEKYISQ